MQSLQLCISAAISVKSSTWNAVYGVTFLYIMPMKRWLQWSVAIAVLLSSSEIAASQNINFRIYSCRRLQQRSPSQFPAQVLHFVVMNSTEVLCHSPTGGHERRERIVHSTNAARQTTRNTSNATIPINDRTEQ